jgi:hypothetical protein
MTRRSIAFSPCSIADPQNPGSPNRGFSLAGRLPIGNSPARADRQRRELIDRVAAGASARELLFEALGHVGIRQHLVALGSS